MSAGWIKKWLNDIIARNSDSEYGKELEQAYKGNDDMLAVLVRLNLRDKTGQLHFAAQNFEPPGGRNRFRSWGVEWTG